MSSGTKGIKKMTKFEKLTTKIQLANALMDGLGEFILDHKNDYTPVLRFRNDKGMLGEYAKGIDDIDEYLTDYFKLTFRNNNNHLKGFLEGRIF